MKYRSFKWPHILCLVLVLLLLCGCADTGEPPKPSDDGTAPNNPFNEKPVVGDGETAYPEPAPYPCGFMGGFTVGGVAVTMEEVAIPMLDDDTLQRSEYPYTGDGPVEIDFYMNPDDDNPREFGITLFFNGVPQPFSVGECGSIAPTDGLTMEYRFDYHGDRKCLALPLSFTPVCGKAGEELLLSIVLTESPSYKAKHESACNTAWLRVSSFATVIDMETDAPTQQTVEALKIDNGFEWDKSMYDPTASILSSYLIGNDLHREVWDQYYATDQANPGSAKEPEEFKSDYDVPIFRPHEDGTLNLRLYANSEYTIPCYVGVRLDGELVPIFDGKYYAEVIMPVVTPGQPDPVILDYDIDLSAYLGARTVQMVVIPIPVAGTDYEWGVTSRPRVMSTDVAWIRYEGE